MPVSDSGKDTTTQKNLTHIVLTRSYQKTMLACKHIFRTLREYSEEWSWATLPSSLTENAKWLQDEMFLNSEKSETSAAGEMQSASPAILADNQRDKLIAI